MASATTGTTLNTVTSPVTYNAETQTLTAVVTGQTNDGHPLGTVTFQYAGPTTICSTSTVASSTSTSTTYSCGISASQLNAGTYAVTAVFAPGTPSSSNTNYAYSGSSSSPAQNIVINPASATTGTTLNTVTSPVTYNAETQTLTAVVTGQTNDGHPLGTVTFQ
ncbi:MAG TPA: hypothetical protein VGZ68_11095, partial [Acidimicrobiales bacterium]|nr:hypothetical protein [Acidimicrobiales bacterium]